MRQSGWKPDYAGNLGRAAAWPTRRGAFADSRAGSPDPTRMKGPSLCDAAGRLCGHRWRPDYPYEGAGPLARRVGAALRHSRLERTYPGKSGQAGARGPHGQCRAAWDSRAAEAATYPRDEARPLADRYAIMLVVSIWIIRQEGHGGTTGATGSALAVGEKRRSGTSSCDSTIPLRQWAQLPPGGGGPLQVRARTGLAQYSWGIIPHRVTRDAMRSFSRWPTQSLRAGVVAGGCRGFLV